MESQMSVYSNPPKTHLLNPLTLTLEWTTCGIWSPGLTVTDDWKLTTCGNCKRSNVYRMKRMGITRPDWKEDDAERD
jgi:hypothetical protein